MTDFNALGRAASVIVFINLNRLTFKFEMNVIVNRVADAFIEQRASYVKFMFNDTIIIKCHNTFRWNTHTQPQ